MRRTLQEVLIDRYYTGRQRRRAANAFEMSWLITQNRRLINEDRVYITDYRYYTVNGLYKRVIELDCDGEAFFVCPCTEGTKDFNKLVEMGWEVIPDDYMDMYSKEVKAL